MQFDFFRLRFHFRALDTVRFGDGNSANTLRGAFGTVLREVACTPRCGGQGAEVHQPGCPYARIFEPRAARPNGPSGLADWPRPFIFRTWHLDAQTLPAGEDFHFDVHLFDLQLPLLYFVEALKRLATAGLGPRRGRAVLGCIEQLDTDDRLAARVWDGEELLPPATPSSAPFEPEPCETVGVRFVTPTELKCGDRPVERPEFSVLFARIRDRLSTLRALYGPGPLEIDFRGMGERAARIQMTRCDLREQHRVRRSSRTGQVHPWGGFTGEAEYQGDLAEFMPYLRIARWTGVGRQTVWGKGEIAIAASRDGSRRAV